MELAEAIEEKVPRNTLSNFAGSVVSLGVGFFLTPFTVHRLGAAEYGVWMLAGSVVGCSGLLGLGLNQALVKRSAEYLCRGEVEKLSQMASILWTLYLLIGAGAGSILFFLSFYLPQAFHLSPKEASTFAQVLRIMGLQTIFGFPMAVWGGLVVALQDFHVGNLFGILGILLAAGGTVLLLSNGYGLIGLIWMGFGLGVLSWLITIWWVKRRIPGLRVRLSLFHPRQIRDLVQLGGVMFLWGIAGKVVHESDRVIVGLFLPVTSVTIYAVGMRIHDYSRLAFTNFLVAAFPASAELSARGETQLLRRLYLKGTKYTLAAYGGVAVALLLFGQEFIALWMGEGFEQSVWVMNILVLGSLYQAQNVTGHVMLVGMEKLRVFTWVMGVYPILNLLLSLALVLYWGLLGVALATALTYLIIETAFAFYILRVFEVEPLDLLRRCHGGVALALLLPVIMGWNLRSFLNLESWVGLLGAVGTFLVFYTLSLWLLGLSRREREAVGGWFLKSFSMR